MPDAEPVTGQPPELGGAICEALLCEGFSADGIFQASANVVHLRFRGTWHRLCVDAGVMAWKHQDRQPAPWAVTNNGWGYTHADVGASVKIIGQRLACYETTFGEGTARVSFVFDYGRTIIIEKMHMIARTAL